MEAATPLRHPHVSLQGDRVLIDGLVVADETLARLIAEAVDPDTVATDALEIGARVLDRELTGANAEFVKTEFEKVSKSVEAEFGARARTVSEELAKQLDTVFSDGSSTAVQHRIKELVTEALQRSREDMTKLFTAGDGSNPLARTIDEIRAADKRQREELRQLGLQLQELRDEKQKLEEVAEERERGTAKGRTYEEAVCEAIDSIAKVLGDVADPVGDEPGTGGKKGDVLVGIDGCNGPERGRIVFEAKDKQLSKPKFYADLDGSMEQRDADYAVLVVPTPEEVPAKLHSLREYQGDKLIAVFDPEDGSKLELEFAYRVARARVTALREGADEIDAAAVRATVARAVAAMDDVRKIKSQLTTAQNGIGGARDLLEAVEARVRAELSQVDDALAPAAPQDALPID